MTRIFLSRHGQTEWNVQRRMQGHNNSDLTELGKKQALALAEIIKNIEIDIVYSSSSLRAVDTAKLIVGDRKVTIVPNEIGRAHV